MNERREEVDRQSREFHTRCIIQVFHRLFRYNPDCYFFVRLTLVLRCLSNEIYLFSSPSILWFVLLMLLLMQ
jgi:hypothetical protein